MNALLLKQYKQLELVDMPRPEIAADEVLVRVRVCGICGSDVHGWDGSTGRRVPPLVMGHEAAGVIAATGSAVKRVREGDRVTFDSMINCGACAFCRRGRINLCDNRQVLGVSCNEYRRHGAFAEYVAVPERILFPLPGEMTFEQAAMIEPVSVAVHAVNLTLVRLGDIGVVVGTGMVGLLVLQALRLAGCSRVIAIDIDDDKLALASSLGAAEVLNAKTMDAATRARELSADVAVEVVGTTEAVGTAIAAVRKGGTVTLVGNLSPSVDLPLQSVVTREVRLQGSCASSGEYPECIDLVARGAIRVDPLISAVAPLAAGASWFTRLYAGERKLMKVMLKP